MWDESPITVSDQLNDCLCKTLALYKIHLSVKKGGCPFRLCHDTLLGH